MPRAPGDPVDTRSTHHPEDFHVRRQDHSRSEGPSGRWQGRGSQAARPGPGARRRLWQAPAGAGARRGGSQEHPPVDQHPAQVQHPHHPEAGRRLAPGAAEGLPAGSCHPRDPPRGLHRRVREGAGEGERAARARGQGRGHRGRRSAQPGPPPARGVGARRFRLLLRRRLLRRVRRRLLRRRPRAAMPRRAMPRRAMPRRRAARPRPRRRSKLGVVVPKRGWPLGAGPVCFRSLP
jgi:hypothetical protein